MSRKLAVSSPTEPLRLGVQPCILFSDNTFVHFLCTMFNGTLKVVPFFLFFSEFIIFSTDVWIIMWGSRDAETNYVHEFTSMWELVVWMISSLLFRQSSAKYRKLITAQNGVWETWLINIYVLWYTQTLPIKFGRKQKLYIWKITNFGSYFKRMIW